jgi:hypothetical protein
VLADAASRERWGSRPQRRVYQEFLVFSQLRRWLGLLAMLVERKARGPQRRDERPERPRAGR